MRSLAEAQLSRRSETKQETVEICFERPSPRNPTRDSLQLTWVLAASADGIQGLLEIRPGSLGAQEHPPFVGDE